MCIFILGFVSAVTRAATLGALRCALTSTVAVRGIIVAAGAATVTVTLRIAVIVAAAIAAYVFFVAATTG